MARLKNRPQSIYVMEAPTGESKIGIAEDPKTRLVGLRSSIPRGEIKLRFASEPSQHAWMFEKRAHEILADKRLNGEWFDIPADDAIEVVRKTIAYVFSQQSDMFSDIPHTCGRRRRTWTKVNHVDVLERLKLGESAASIAASIGANEGTIRQIANKNGLKLRSLKCRTTPKKKVSDKVLTDGGICRKGRITKIAGRAGAKPQSAGPRRPQATPTILTATRADKRGIAVRVLSALGYRLAAYKGSPSRRYQILNSDGSSITSRMRLSDVENWIEEEQARRCASDLPLPTNLSYMSGSCVLGEAPRSRGSLYARKDAVEGRISHALTREQS